MKRVLQRILKWTGIALAAIVALALMVMAIVLNTSYGGRVALDYLPRLSIDAAAVGFEGRLVRNFTLTGIVYRSEQIDVTVDTLHVEWRPSGLIRKRLLVDRVVVVGVDATVYEPAPSAEPGVVAADAAATTALELPLDIILGELRLRRAGVTLPGDIEVRDVSVVAAGRPDAYRVRLDATVRGGQVPETVMHVDAEGGMEDARLEQLHAQLLEGSVTVTGRAAWAPRIDWDVFVAVDSIAPGPILGDSTQFDGTVTLRAATRGELTGAGPRAFVRIDSLSGALGGYELSGRGSIDALETHADIHEFEFGWGEMRVALWGDAQWEPGIAWDIALSAENIKPVLFMPDPDPRLDGSVTLRASTRGELTDAGLEATVRVDTLTGTLGGRVVTGRGELDARRTNAAIHEFEFSWGNMGLQIEGEASWEPDIAWDLELKADSVTPSIFMPDRETLPGFVTSYISTRGRKTDVISASLEIDSLEGVLRGLDISGSGAVTMQGDRVEADSLSIVWGGNQIRLAGVYDENIDLRVRLAFPDLTEVVPEAGGSVYFSGSLRGSLEAPDVDARARVDTFHFAEYRVGRFAADVDINLAGGRAVNVDISARDIEAAGRIVDSLTVVAAGTTTAHEASLGVSAKGDALGIGLKGSWVDEVWVGTLDRLEAGLGGFGDWRLVQPASIEASRTSIRADTMKLVSGEATVTASGYWGAQDSMGVYLKVDSLAYARAAMFYPERISVAGWVGLALGASVSPAGDVVADLSIQSTPGRVSWKDRETTHAIAFDSTFVAGTVGPDGVFAGLGLHLRRGNDVITTIKGTFAMPDVHNVREMPEHPEFSSRFRALFTDLSFIGPLSRDINRTGGSLKADAGFEGTFDDPRFAGTIDLNDGRIELVPLGISVRDIEVSAEGRRGQGLSLTGSMRSGGGVLELATEMTREKSHVHVRGENFVVTNTAEAKIRISPDIEMALTGRRIDLKGQVLVPYAKVEVFQVPETAVGVSRDVVYVTADTSEAKQPIDIYADLRVTLAQDSVTFRGFGFNGEIQGSMTVSERPRRPTTASGELKIVKGQYNAYGQLLSIDPGRIRYAGGPIDNPGFDIRAFRDITEHGVVAGLLIRGTARRPQVTVFSDPAMSQNEALSYLLTGQPLSSGSQRDMAAAAALSMGMAQGNAALQSVGRDVGLDDVRFETGGTMEEASFVAGKYLSPRLYISNTMGLFDRVSTWRVRYFMSKRWTLQAESGKSTGSDIFYRIERGK